MALMQTIVDSFSGLVNSVTGTGTARDKLTHARWQFARPLDDQLISLYRSTWIARKIVDIPIDDMLREGWTWQADSADMTKLEDEEKRLGLRAKLHQALKRDSVYGGGALIIGDGSENPELPLLPESVGKGGLRYLIVSGRGELHVERLVRRPGPDYGQPEIYVMTPMDGGPIRIHPSRVIPFSLLPIPSPLGVMSETEFWGDSSLAAVMRDIAAAVSGIAGTGRLMDELAVAYHKIAGFTERMAQSDGEEAIRRVISLMNQMKSSVNSVAMDAEDSVDVITANFSGIPDALRSLMQNVSGAADIPLTRFLGNSPDGMNSTGASDIRNYYDRLAGRRASYVEPGIAYLDQFLIRSALGREDDNIYRIWKPLWQLSETEQVDLDSKKLKAMQDLQASGIVHDHVVHEVTKTIMIDSPTFQGAEVAFDEAESMPDPEPDEVEEANTVVGKPLLRVVDELADAQQPRHPAGSSKGGQWTRSGGGGSVVAENYNTIDATKVASIVRERVFTASGVAAGDPESLLSDQDIASVVAYTQVSYVDVNESLRRDSLFDPDGRIGSMDNLRDFEVDLNSALGKLPDYEGVVHRGAGFITRSGAQEAFDQYSSKIGGTVSEKAFVSTSKSPEASREGQIRFVINSKTGKDVSRISLKGTAEEEVLFRSGSKFKVIAAKVIREGREYLVEMEEV